MTKDCNTCVYKEGSCYPSTTIFDKDKTCKSYIPDYEGYIAELEKENAELKADNDARKFAMTMSENVEKQLREENAKLKTDYETFKDGAEFGYNKANEWHYPSKGELPKEDTAEKETLYLLWFGLDDSDYMTGVFSHGRFWCFDSGWYETNEVIAWKEIILPELSKESK